MIKQQQPSLEEPRSVVQQLVTKFHAPPDINSIQNINEAFESIQTVRAKKLANSRDTLHRMSISFALKFILIEWMRKVEAAKWEAQRPADRTEQRHSDHMSEAERERFSLAKSINELELATQQYEAILVQQKEKLEALRTENGRLAQRKPGPLDLQIEIYRGLGFEWLDDPSSYDPLLSSTKCRVKSTGKNDVYSVVLDGATSIFDQTNQLWRAVGK